MDGLMDEWTIKKNLFITSRQKTCGVVERETSAWARNECVNKYPVSFIYAAWLSGKDPTGPLRRVRRESEERAWIFHFPMIPSGGRTPWKGIGLRQPRWRKWEIVSRPTKNYRPLTDHCSYRMSSQTEGTNSFVLQRCNGTLLLLRWYAAGDP